MLASDQPSKPRPKVQYDATDLYVEELLSKVGTTKKTVKFSENEIGGSTTTKKLVQPKKEDETSKYVRDLMRSVFQVEEAAA